jgi:hypothetical protein
LGGSLSGYFQKKQKKPEVAGISTPTTSAIPTVSAPTATSAATPRGSGGKSPTGFVGFEQYFGANAPAVQKMAQGATAQAAAARPTMGQQAMVAPSPMQAGMPKAPSFQGALSKTGINGAKRQAAPSVQQFTGTTEQQIAQAQAAQQRLNTLAEPGGYEAQANYSPELERFDAMLMGGVLPKQAKAEASRLGALEKRLVEQQAQVEQGNKLAAEEQAQRDSAARAAWAKSMVDSGSTLTEQELMDQYGNMTDAERQARLEQERYMAERAQAAKRYYS